MQRSKIVTQLAKLASKAQLTVTPDNVATLAKEANLLFSEAAKLINELEAEEREAAKEESSE